MAKTPKKGRGKILEFRVPEDWDESLKRFDELTAKVRKIHEEMEANPNFDGWLRLNEILAAASTDARVCSSKGASSFVDLMREIAGDAMTASSAEEALQPLIAIIKSSNARDMSYKSRLLKRKMEAWIVEEWAACKAKKQSKRNFAQVYVAKLLDKFGETVKERTISEIWLSKS